MYGRAYVPAALPVPRRRGRRLPRGDRRLGGAGRHAALPQADRPDRHAAACRGRHPAAVAHRARQGGVPAVRPADRQVALAGLLGPGQARGLQQGVVGAARAVPGRRAAGGALRGRLRPGREVPHRRATCPTRATSSRRSTSSSSTRRCATASGYTGPLNRCTFYGSKAAGDKLKAMLEAGASQPAQVTLARMTGTDHLDAAPMLEYFRPLYDWLQPAERAQSIDAGVEGAVAAGEGPAGGGRSLAGGGRGLASPNPGRDAGDRAHAIPDEERPDPFRRAAGGSGRLAGFLQAAPQLHRARGQRAGDAARRSVVERLGGGRAQVVGVLLQFVVGQAGVRERVGRQRDLRVVLRPAAAGGCRGWP